MAIILAESFDLYATDPGVTNGTGVLTNWTCAYPYDSAIIGGRYAGQALRKPQAGGVEPWYRVLPEPLTTFTLTYDWRNNTLGLDMLHMMHDSGNDQLIAVANNDGSITIRSGGSVLGTTIAGILSANNWFCIEIGAVIDPAAGSVDVWVEGAHALSLSGLNTQNVGGGFGTVMIPENGQTDVDNLVVQDVVASIGPLRMDPYFPTADVSTGTFAASSGSSFFAMIDENPNDQDGTYIESGTVGDVASFSFQSIPADTSTILEVCATCVARDGGAGAASSEMQIGITDGTNTIDGMAVTLGPGYVFTQTFFPTAADGTAWTYADFDAITGTIGYAS